MVIGDFHMHTLVSDGRPHPREVVKIAARRGLDAISVTDHDTFEGSLKAIAYARELGEEILRVVPGNEVRTTWGDVLVYCPQVPPTQPPREPGELVDYSREHGCALVPAHPYDTLRSGVGDRLRFFKRVSLSLECFNAGALLPGVNRRALEAARREGLSCMAGSDAHIPEYIGVYRTRVRVADASDVVEGIVKAIARGQVEPIVAPVGLGLLARRLLWGGLRRLSPRL